MKLILVLHNIRSTYNVGAILRTAEGLGVEKVVYSGYTPRYQDPQVLPHLREKLSRQIAKAALGAEKIVPQELLAENSPLCLTKWLECATMEGYAVVGLENNLSGTEQERRILLGKTQNLDLSEKVILILGEEVGGIPEPVREQCRYFLEIPMCGQKESFNVSVATGIAVWGLQNS